MPQGNPFRTSNRNQMGSNVFTDRPQGGGDKKAGFPYQVGRPAATYGTEAYLYKIDQPLLRFNPVFGTYPVANISRPVGSTSRVTYWHLPFGEYGW
jgi:hypothetical protein